MTSSTALPTNMLRIGTLCCFALLSHGALGAEQTFALDPVHTRVMFSVSHAGFSNPMFTIAGTTGTLVFDPDDWTKAHVEARIPVSGLELTDAKWRNAVLGGKFLDASRFPEARFVSTRIEPVDATHAKVHGTLTLHGVSGEVQLDVVFHQLMRHPLPPFRRTAGFSATGTVSRKAFGITDWPSVVGDAVALRIEAEGTRARASGEPQAADTEPAPSSSVPATPTSVSAPPSSEPVPASSVVAPPAVAPSAVAPPASATTSPPTTPP